MQAWYMSGAGNDFMVIDARGMELDFSRLALELCKLADCDGFMAVDHSDKADFKLHFYNSDGSRGEMCGNGSRCVSRFAYDNGIAPEKMTIETDAGIIDSVRLSENQYRVKLNNPGILDLHRKGDVAYVELGTPGVPHAVAEVPDLEHDQKEKLYAYAKGLRHDPAFPKGANANLYRILGPERVRILTFERGVEDYTLACGTGSGSVACVLWTQGKLPTGKVAVENPGGTLYFEITGTDGTVNKLLMSGPADILKIYEI